MATPTFNKIISFMRKSNYQIYDSPYKLNIVGVRNAESKPNKFDDNVFVFYKNDKNDWIVKNYNATTDTGTYWLLNPMNPKGAAMMKEGQYVNAYQKGYHRGQPALVQVKPIVVYRDYDRNAIFDFGTLEQTGLFGINIHRAGENSQNVDKWSAGCQVFQKSADFEEFMELAEKHRNLFGNEFTYTLIDERALARKGRRILLYSGIALSVMVGIGFTIYKIMKR